MTTIELLKDTAQNIIAFASNDNRSQTWDEQPSAPKGGFDDRAGFVLIDDVEAYADVALLDQDQAVIRARIAKVTGEGDEERFWIVALDFYADANAVKKAIANRSDISGQILIDILGQEKTTPKYVQVSYNTGKDQQGNPDGARYEYPEDQVLSLSDDARDAFAEALALTFEGIMKGRKSS